MTTFINYKQADSRWGSLNYNKSSTMAAAGCGPATCAILISGLNPKITPIDTMKFMQTHGDAKHVSFAIPNQGTAHNGIPACLTYFGVTDAHEINVDTSMTEVWKYMKNGYICAFLFNGMPWTTQGHYVAVTGYKYENSKHYLYTRDPGGRNRTGWYAYETTMKGRVPKVWVGALEKKDIPTIPKPSGKYDGPIPGPGLQRGSTGSSVGEWQDFLNWYCKNATDLKPLNKDNGFGQKTEDRTIIFQHNENLTEDGIVGKKTAAAASNYAKTYPKENGRTILATLMPDAKVTLASNQTVQSLAVVKPGDAYIFYASRDGKNQTIKSYDVIADKINGISKYQSLGHANGACYADGYFYVCSYKGNTNTNLITVISANTMIKAKSIKLPVAVSGIAYYNGNFYGSKGKWIYIFNRAFTLKGKFKRKADGTAQDIAAFNNHIYSCRSYVKGSISYIDVYTTGGKYIGSYKVTANELESCDFDDNGYLYYCTWNAPQLIKTTTKV